MSSLEERYDRWVETARAAGRVWMLADDEHNVVMEDPDEDRDLHMFFTSADDARPHAEGAAEPYDMDLETIVPILRKAEDRGDGLALWDGQSWVVADPGPLADDLSGG
jgi:hypothetical protein